MATRASRPLPAVPETGAQYLEPPHYHPNDRVMVLGGTMSIGTEPSGDKTRTVGVQKVPIHP